MAQVEFQYNGINTVIQCKEDQTMYEICNIYISKSNINENNINYVYNGKGGKQFDKNLTFNQKQFDKNLTFNQVANSYDKTRKKMNILVIDNNTKDNDDNALIRSKSIICPDCGEDIKIKNIENYKIDLYECKNNHSMNKIPLDEFEKTQMINLKNIACNICKEKNKYNKYKYMPIM